MRKLLSMIVATASLAGCATSLSEHPEYASLQTVVETEISGEGPVRIRAELNRTSKLANLYLATGQKLNKEATVAGAGVLGSGFYGAAVTAFNPAPTNLMAAALGLGSAQAWQTALKPAARARVYVQGYRALECLHGAGDGLLENAPGVADRAKDLREQIEEDFLTADTLRQAVESTSRPDKAALLLRLAAIRASLQDLDVALKIEANVVAEAPGEIAKVRRQIESTVDRLLAGQAPDYAAALALISESTKPKGADGGDRGDAPAQPESAMAFMAEGKSKPKPKPVDLAIRVAQLEGRLASHKRWAPNLAATAYANMGKCVAVAG